ncbi:ATP12 family chaperone protein [Kordiimonas sp.]|uniref:ATP12 family chaperone protein n=1 Tax=Kordiimonas sp. TaxID=1970157 RepID=UPI003A8F9F6B
MRKFYQSVGVEAADTGHVVTLDGRMVKTPAKASLILPTRALADAVAMEWDAQEDKILPDTMPQTRLASTALDRVAPRHSDVVAEVAAFGGTDLLCYRADEPEELIQRQNRVWNPYLEWAKAELGAPLRITSGILPVAQENASLEHLKARVAGHDAFELTALHGLTNALGSLVLTLAYMEGFSPLEAVWQASILDATHQEEQWGLDDEVAEKRAFQHADLTATAEFISHLRNK